MENSEPNTSLMQRRVALIGKKETLEATILANQGDDKVLASIRADYRAVCEELETFYDDLPLEERE